MIWVDEKYINVCSFYLDKFRWVSKTIANCRCPICKDSKKDQNKARGYFYSVKSDHFNYKCHNCNASMSFHSFLKLINESLFDEYIAEKYLDNSKKPVENIKVKAPKFLKTELDNNSLVVRLDKLSDDHFAKKYCLDRKIPRNKLKNFYFSEDFFKFGNSIIEEKYPDEGVHPRLIIPFYDMYNKFIGYQARSLGKDKPKYFTLKLNNDDELLYNVNNLNFKNKIYVVEGPIDSIFLNNSIAVCSSALTNCSLVDKIQNLVLVYDNEPRNKEICKLIESAISKNYSVCIWKDPRVKNCKDINDMIVSGLTEKDVLDIINNNTFKGLTALLEFNDWKAV